MAKRKHSSKSNKRKKHSNKKTNIINIILIMILISLCATIGSYFLLLKKHDIKEKQQSKISKVSQLKQDELELKKLRQERLSKYYNTTAKELENKEIKNTQRFEENTKDSNKIYITPKETKRTIKDIDKIKKPVLKIKKEELAPIIPINIIDNKKPKLSIVIDDVTLPSQVRKIKALGFTVTMAFMPPTKQHPNSAKIALDLPFYIIHFPLQAQSFKFEEENTLHTDFTYEMIEQRVKKIRELYPNARYTNNHTGSKFTSHEGSMDKFIKALKKYNFIFIDSRTTSKSVAKKYTKKYGLPYIARNVFLDNEQNFTYVQNQLKQAIRIAKKRGHAIAIGHPYSITMEVLRKSKHLLKGLDLVYVKDIPTN